LKTSFSPPFIMLWSCWLCTGLAFPWSGQLFSSFFIADEPLFRGLLQQSALTDRYVNQPNDSQLLIMQTLLLLCAFLGAFINPLKKKIANSKSFLYPWFKYIEDGFGVNSLMRLLEQGLSVLGSKSTTLIDYNLWMYKIPLLLEYFIIKPARNIYRIDTWISINIHHMLKIYVKKGMRLLQLTHTGDIQWYLLFCFMFIIIIAFFSF
jgi:hypothetical protein